MLHTGLYLIGCTIKEYRSIKRAVRTLEQAGIPVVTALEMVVTHHDERDRQRTRKLEAELLTIARK
jgi:hypothetical protein